MKKELTFHPIQQESWGFSPLRPLSELRDHLGISVGTLYLTYRNHPELVPGKPIWVFKRQEVGGWLVENEESEDSAKREVLRRLRGLKTQNPRRTVFLEKPRSAEWVARWIIEKGGITLNCKTGRKPKMGYAVAPAKETETQIPTAEFSANHLKRFIRNYTELLRLPGMYLGARVKEGVVFLDVSLVTRSLKTAVALALESNQFAIRCLRDSRSLHPKEACPPEDIAIAKRKKSYRDLTNSIRAALKRIPQPLTSGNPTN